MNLTDHSPTPAKAYATRGFSAHERTDFNMTKTSTCPRRLHTLSGFVVVLFLLNLLAFAQEKRPMKFDSGTISGLNARNIGSAAMSGRITAIDGVDEGGKVTVFAGAASGGVWKSINGATTFKPVFDRQ